MKLSAEVVMLVIYALSLSMVLLGVAVDSVRTHRKLNRILSLLGTNKDDKQEVSYGKDKR